MSTITVGLDNRTKPSSRGMRPDGGAHTDIFSSDPPRRPAATSAGEPEKKEAHGEQATPRPEPVPAEPVETPKTLPVPEPQQPAESPQRRVRVPPGGFASVLW